MTQVYLDPLEDSGFKILFSKKRNMIAALETLLDRKIEDLEYIDTEKLGVTIDETKSRFDLAVKFTDGGTCVVEMQKARLAYFNYRSVFYASHLVQRQATDEHDRQFEAMKARGKRPYWNYWYGPVYFVGILASGWGDDPSSSKEGPLLEHYRLKELSTGEDMNVDYNFLYLRLDRFDKGELECETALDKFAHTLKNMNSETAKPESFCEEWLMNLYDDALLANLPADIAHKLLISRYMTTENDWLVAISEAEARAGKAEAKGREEERMANARAFKFAGVEISVIAKATGLSEAEIDAL